MTLDQYKVEIVGRLEKLENHEYGEDCDSQLGALNEVSEIVHHALKEYGDDRSLINLNKHLVLSIMIMELAIDSGLIALKM